MLLFSADVVPVLEVWGSLSAVRMVEPSMASMPRPVEGLLGSTAQVRVE